jgi:two-component system, response regulator, stage 0 sporulation protein F
MSQINSAKRRVLIADDDEGNRALFTFLLEEQGWEVNEATDGKEALEKVLEWQPDLLILDYKMPQLTGGEVYQHLQLYKIQLIVILISSYLELEKLASNLGVDYYLRKPFEITDFLRTINLACQDLIC